MSSVESGELDSGLVLEDADPQCRIKKQITLRRLFALILKHRTSLMTGVFTVLVGTCATLLEPRIFGYAIDEAIIPKRWDKLQKIGCTLILVIGIRIFSIIRQGYFFELLGQKVTQELRLMLFNHIEKMPIRSFDKNPAGRFLTRVTNDVASLNEMFSAGFLSIIFNVLLVFGILLWLLVLDFKLGLISASVFPFLVAFSVYFSRQLKAAYQEARKKLSALNAFLAENLMGMKIIHLFNRQGLHLKRFDFLNQKFMESQVASIRAYAYFQPAITVASGISISLVIWYGGIETLEGHVKLGVLVAYFSYILSLFQPIREIADKWNIFLSGMASAERLFAVLDSPVEVGSVDTPASSIEGLQGHIQFEGVWFAYEEENWILRDFTLEILPGQKIGIVGHTGAGKSTVIQLLLRFYEPQRGRILIDGKDIRSYDRRALRASIGMVQQDVFLFSGSFFENITLWGGKAACSAENVLIDLKIHEQSGGTLRERGSNFSMGERQVIAFARALAADPKIWILDEATANLDSETERKLQYSLNAASQNKTTLLVAHRLATIRNVDRIIVLHHGSLVESGKHDELVKKKGLYFRLYQYQEHQADLRTSLY